MKQWGPLSNAGMVRVTLSIFKHRQVGNRREGPHFPRKKTFLILSFLRNFEIFFGGKNSSENRRVHFSRDQQTAEK